MVWRLGSAALERGEERLWRPPEPEPLLQPRTQPLPPRPARVQWNHAERRERGRFLGTEDGREFPSEFAVLVGEGDLMLHW